MKVRRNPSRQSLPPPGADKYIRGRDGKPYALSITLPSEEHVWTYRQFLSQPQWIKLNTTEFPGEDVLRDHDDGPSPKQRLAELRQGLSGDLIYLVHNSLLQQQPLRPSDRVVGIVIRDDYPGQRVRHPGCTYALIGAPSPADRRTDWWGITRALSAFLLSWHWRPLLGRCFGLLCPRRRDLVHRYRFTSSGNAAAPESTTMGSDPAAPELAPVTSPIASADSSFSTWGTSDPARCHRRLSYPLFQSRLLRGHTLLASPPELDIFFRTRCLVPSCECGSRFCRRWQVPSLLCRLHLSNIYVISMFNNYLDNSCIMCIYFKFSNLPHQLIYTRSEAAREVYMPKLKTLKSSTIIVKVTFKSDKLKIRNNSADLFFITVSDETGHIKCNFYNNNCKRFYNVMKMNTMYKLNKFSITQPNRLYNYLKNEIEITIMDSTVIQRVEGDLKCKELKEKFVDLAAIPKLLKNDIISTRATLQKIRPRVEFFSKKKQKTFAKKELELINDNNFKSCHDQVGKGSNSEPVRLTREHGSGGVFRRHDLVEQGV
ncbi:unnamed protein product [Trichogramma brassicae]|uniref:OB domain-containing protein n=1 Tax=Trichogramma brassicae TaxID=86971 RepID=A0A6H5J1N7_9HYME|nr:unnamed protein product [Trichogramma brassicae]